MFEEAASRALDSPRTCASSITASLAIAPCSRCSRCSFYAAFLSLCNRRHRRRRNRQPVRFAENPLTFLDEVRIPNAISPVS